MALHIHYEHFTVFSPDPYVPPVQLTYLSFSSVVNKIHVYAQDNKTLADCVYYVKQIAADQRDYDAATKIWTIPLSGFLGIERIYNLTHAVLPGNWHPHADLRLFVSGMEGRESEFEKHEVPRPEDFFYNGTQPVGIPMPLASIEAKLEELFHAIDTTISLSALSSDEKLRLYKKAARRFHPDVNNGDGSKMSELNMLWQMYKMQIGAN